MMAPSIRVAVGEEVGLAPGAVTTGQIATAQRMLGESADPAGLGQWEDVLRVLQ